MEDDDIRVSDVHNNEDMKYTDESSKNGEEDAKTYTVEEAVEAIGFGRFQLVVYFVGGTITVSCQLCPPPPQPSRTQLSNIQLPAVPPSFLTYSCQL